MKTAVTKAPTKAKQGAPIEDLTPKTDKNVRGGITLSDFHFVAKVTKTSP